MQHSQPSAYLLVFAAAWGVGCGKPAGGDLGITPPDGEWSVPDGDDGRDSHPRAPVIITEIMYQPADEQSDHEDHEFVEILNRSPDTISLAGWTLLTGKGEMRFSFPADATIGAGQYLTIARRRQVLAAVSAYHLDASTLLGDYEGELPNGGAALLLRDPTGATIDGVHYDDAFPWPVAADGLGVGEDWLPNDQRPLAKHRGMGRSLERVNVDFELSDSPAAWEASALDGATPGRANSAVAPQVFPVVEALAALPENASSGLIRKADRVDVAAAFSTFSPVEDVAVEYVVDPVVRPMQASMTEPMKIGADGRHHALLPARPNHSLVGYRIRVTRDGTSRVVAPRPSDPFTWFSYFVSPVVYVRPNVETRERVYHLFIKPADWTQLEAWLAMGRETGPGGCTINPDWQSMVPATFVYDGRAYDVRVRYEGSLYQRPEGLPIKIWSFPGPALPPGASLRALSWRIRFPKYDPFFGQKAIVLNKMNQGCPGAVSYVEGRLLEKAGLPIYQEAFARLHINGGYYHYMAQPEDVDERLLRRVYPDEEVGDLFKDDGHVKDSGLRARGDFTPITAGNPDCPQYSILERYQATYPRRTFEYRPYDEIIDLIKGLAVARQKGAPAVREYFARYWDIDALLATFAIRNWSGVWDDTVHNMFPYKRPATGKWIAIQQDFEWDFGLGKTSSEPWHSPWNPRESMYLGWNSPDPFVSKQCELPPDQSTYCNDGGFSALKDALIGAFKPELDDKIRALAQKGGPLDPDVVIRTIDEAEAAFGLADWLADPVEKACDVTARTADMRTWARARAAYVKEKLP